MIKTLNVHIATLGRTHPSSAGGFIYCSNCRYILGYLNAEGYQNIKMILHCRCGKTGYIKSVSTTPACATTQMLRAQNRIFQCKKCGLPLFSLRKNTVTNFTFEITCRCGKEYIKDIMQAEEEKRIPELVNIIKRIKF